MSEKSYLDAQGQGEGRQPRGASISNRLLWLLVGAGFGAAMALLFAPRSGEELRNDIADATRRGIDRSREAAQAGAKAYEKAGERTKAADLGGDETKRGY